MLNDRASGPEYMDGPDFDLEKVHDTFSLLVPVNRLFGGIRHYFIIKAYALAPASLTKHKRVTGQPGRRGGARERRPGAVTMARVML